MRVGAGIATRKFASMFARFLSEKNYRALIVVPKVAVFK
jgi:hypothetical protein